MDQENIFQCKSLVEKFVYKGSKTEFYQTVYNNGGLSKKKQECIPVRLLQWPSRRGGGLLGGGVSAQGGVCLGGCLTIGCLPRGCLPRGLSVQRGVSAHWGVHPPVDRQTPVKT